MAKKMGKVILLGVVAGATAAGVYHYLQTKDQKVDEYDDFDDLDSFDDTVNEEEKTSPNRSYITIDTAKYFVNDSIDKAKDLWGKAQQKIKKTIEDATEIKADEDEDIFDVIEEGMNKVAADAEAAIDEVETKITETDKKDSKKDSKKEDTKAAEAEEEVAEETDEAEELEEIEDESSEEFFDDDEA